MTQITIFGDVPSKKNQRQIFYLRGRPISIPSKRHKAWHDQAFPQLASTESIQKIKAVQITFYPATRRRSDLTNKAESVMDLLVDAAIIEDDNWFVVPNVRLTFGGVDRANPRAEITIT